MLAAGVDIGNSTTEIVLADLDHAPPRPLLWQRRPTRGVKGSEQAALAAARLLDRMERQAGLPCAMVVLTPQAPAQTDVLRLDRAAGPTGRLMVLAAGSPTPGGTGFGVGVPVPVEADPASTAPGQDVVLVAADPLGYRRTAQRVRAWRAAGRRVRAVALAGDEARLVAARCGEPVPIVDGIDAAAVLGCSAVAAEVALPGAFVRVLGDPIRLARELRLRGDEHEHAAAVTENLRGVAAGLVGVRPRGLPPGGDPGEGSAPGSARLQWRDGRSVPLSRAADLLSRHAPGQLQVLHLPGADPVPVRDAWLVDPDRPHLAPALAGARAGVLDRHRLSLATLGAFAQATVWPGAFTADGRRQVLVVGSEPRAARAGALTTPGARDAAAVLDLGAGTLDLVLVVADATEREVTAAGSGDLLTASVAQVLGITHGAAEWVKRGPCLRVDGPHQVSDETGIRHFRERPAPPGEVGWLVVPGPGGELPFSATVPAAQWRAARLALKHAVFADNLARAALAVADGLSGRDTIVVGGPAEDDELLEVLTGVLPGVVLGRADVAGRLGHRWAVAYGLLLLAGPTR